MFWNNIPERHRFRTCSRTNVICSIDTNKDNVWATISRPLTEDERDQVRSGELRARVFNIWRPRVNHSEDFPLAVCDPNTLDLSRDIIMLDNTTPETLA